MSTKNYPPKSKNTKTSISILLHFSRVGNAHYVAIDGNMIDLKDYGISPENFSRLGDEIQNAVRDVLDFKIAPPESKL